MVDLLFKDRVKYGKIKKNIEYYLEVTYKSITFASLFKESTNDWTMV